jgi:hypothetical protein
MLRLCQEPSDVLDCDMGRLHPHGESVCGAEVYITCHGWHSVLGVLESCRPLFKFDILTVYSFYILECMKFLKKNPKHFKRKCDKPGEYLRVTRNNQDNVCPNDLNIPKCDLKLSNKNPNVMIPRIFNAMSKRIKLIDCDMMFIKSVNLYVRERQFYDLHEFFFGD